MENSVSINVDLSTEQGKQILSAVNAIVNSGATASKTPEAKVVKMPQASAPAAPIPGGLPIPNVPMTPPVPATPSAPALPSAPSVPTAPAAPSAPAAPKAPAAPALPPAAPAPAKEPKAPKVTAPVVDFATLDEDGKREAIKKVTTKWSKKGKTTDIKALVAAYGAANVETVPAAYLDHFNWAINQFDTNGQDMAAVLATFGAQ